MAGRKLKFEFDFEDVFKGIQAGVIRELAEYDFQATADTVIRDLKSGLNKEIRLSYSDIADVKREVKDEIKEKVYEEVLKETKEKYLTQFEHYIEEQLLKNPERLESLTKQIKQETIEELYGDLYSSVRSDIKDKLDSVLNSISGTGVKVAGSNFTISQEEYEKLLKRDEMLSALEGAGVDNWEGYDYAIDMLNEDDEDEE